MLEIERKFLVLSDAYKKEAGAKERMVQAYLNSDPRRTVRVRIKGEFGYLTIKGGSKDGGLSRFEWEIQISLEEADALLLLCEPGKIEKTRFLVKSGEHTFEVDEFYGDNQGLVIAEIELSHKEEAFKKPHWLGEELTGNKKYYNSALIRKPYKEW